MLELDPQIAKAIASEPSGQVVAETLSTMRAASNKPSAPPSPGIERQDYTVEGDPAVVIRVHRPTDAEGPLPVVYSMHGGGYVLGSYATDDARLDGWAKSYGCVGVSVDYRLSPETPYPGPLDDCYRGLKWVFDHHRELGIDPHRIGVSGTSAGSGLAAGLALLARDRGEVPLRFQLLDAPMIDDRQLTPSSQRDDLVIFDRHSNRVRLALLPRRPLRHARTFPPTRLPPGPPTSPAFRRRTSVSGMSTGSATTPSTSPPGSTRPACPLNCTCTRGRRTGSSDSSTSPWRGGTSEASMSGSALNSRLRQRRSSDRNGKPRNQHGGIGPDEPGIVCTD